MPSNSGLPLTTKLGCLDELSEQGLAVLNRRPSVAEIQVMAHQQGFLVSRAQASSIVQKWQSKAARLTPCGPVSSSITESSPSLPTRSNTAEESVWDPGWERPAQRSALVAAREHLKVQDTLWKNRITKLSTVSFLVVVVGAAVGFSILVEGWGSLESNWKGGNLGTFALGLTLCGLTWAVSGEIKRRLDQWSAYRQDIQNRWEALGSTMLSRDRALRWRQHPEAYAYAKACLNTETALLEGDVAVIEARWGSAIDELQAQNRTRAQLALLEHPFAPPAAKTPKKVGWK